MENFENLEKAFNQLLSEIEKVEQKGYSVSLTGEGSGLRLIISKTIKVLPKTFGEEIIGKVTEIVKATIKSSASLME